MSSGSDVPAKPASAGLPPKPAGVAVGKPGRHTQGRPPKMLLKSSSGRHELIQRPLMSNVNKDWASPRSPHSPGYQLGLFGSENISVPVIDLGNLHDPKLRIIVMNDLVRAAGDWGCFQIINHGISKELQADMLRVAKEFFAMTDFIKRGFSKAEFHEGFGQSYRTVTGTNNWREVFRHEVAPLIDEDVAEWPTAPEDYKKVTLEYSQKVTGIAQELLKLLSEGLGLKSNYIEESMGGEVTARLLLNNYPSISEVAEAYGLPSHTDPNTLTFLTQDAVGGLEANHNGTWIPVRCLPNSLTINVSDHLQILSNGKYKSVVHRVTINPRATRTSIGIFVAPAQDAWLQVAPEIVTAKEPAQYRKVTFKGYLGEYYKPGRDQTAVFDYALKIPTFRDSLTPTTPRFKFDAFPLEKVKSPRTPPMTPRSSARKLVAAK